MFTKLKQYLSINKSSLIKIAIFFWFYFLLTDLSFADDPATGAWSTKDNFENAKNVVVTATCDGPKGKVIIKVYTREKNNYVTSDSNRITVSYNGKTSTLTELF